MKKILIVEDDRTLSDELKILLDENGYETFQLFNFQNAVKRIIEFSPDLILLDIMLPDANGQNILRDIRKESGVCLTYSFYIR